MKFNRFHSIFSKLSLVLCLSLILSSMIYIPSVADPDPGPQWRVIWKNGDGTDLYDTGNISDTAYDELRDPTTSAPVYPGDVTPTKPSDAQYSYTFSGWKDLDPDDIVEVPGLNTITIFPSFNSSLRSYTVTFSNYNEETLQSSVYEYGSTPAYNGSLPERPSDDEYIYTFTGWDPSITAVSGDTTYTAVFSREAKNNPAPDPDPEPQWRVIWKNDDGTDLYDTGNISDAAYNELKDPTTHALLYPGDVAPTKPSNAKYNYTFSGWKDPGVDDTVEVSGLTTITVSPSFNESLRSYTITFNNYNGETLQSSAFEYGSTPTYNGSTPEKPSDDGYIYSFSGWSSSITAVSGDATYTAVFSRESRSVPMPDTMPDDTMPDVAPIPDPEPAPAYTITFVNYDTTTLQSFTVTSGRIPSYVGPTPIREADNFYTYKFAGWSPEFAGTYADTTYTAQYTAKKRLYTINFVDSDGNNLQTDTLGYDETPSYRGSTPTKKEDDKYTYEFFWSPAVSKVTGDTTYTVSFKKTEKKYKITFVNEDGTVLQSSDYKYGDTPKYTGQEPSKDETAEYIYEFANWSPNITQVTKDATYTAVFKSTDKLYTITFMGEQDGNEVACTIKCKYGETPVYPGDESRLSTRDEEGDAHDFDHWTPEILPVTGETVYHAVYEEQKNGCYIATSVYGSYDTPEVWTLRRFRDGVLDKTWYGRAFIKTYYFISPKLIRIFGKNEAFHNYWEPRLSRFVDYLNNNGFEDTPYTDNSYEDCGSGVGILDMFRVIFGITLPF